MYIVGIHYCHAGFISFKYIPDIGVVVGEHKMNAITKIFYADISPYQRVGNEFKIDAVAVACYLIACDLQAVRFPAMNAIAALHFAFAVCGNIIVLDQAVLTVLNIYAKIGVVKDIVERRYAVAIVDHDGADIVDL